MSVIVLSVLGVICMFVSERGGQKEAKCSHCFLAFFSFVWHKVRREASARSVWTGRQNGTCFCNLVYFLINCTCVCRR